jgi:hypothetical protein
MYENYEEIEQAKKKFEDNLIIGGNAIKANGWSYTKFKEYISKRITRDNNEDQWVFDYQSWTIYCTHGEFEHPEFWGKEYYQDCWINKIKE